jgi:EAL domain-containing protein (putative c-di-GMP-specific phosphodiesterase class I)
VARETKSLAGFIDLGHALRAGWIEFWFQPKVDLHQNQVVGVEMFARAHHPFHGVLPAAVVLPGADEQYLAQLSGYAITSALQASRHLSQQGVRLPVTINVPIAALHNLPTELILDRQPQGEGWAGLIFDVCEDDILDDISGLSRIVEELASCGMKLAADDFGRSLCSILESGSSAAIQQQVEEISRRLIELKSVSICELKLARNLVTGCASDPNRAAVCKIVIDLIHHIGSTAVAVGVEKAVDVGALRDMGCDVGQGHYFGKPAPFEEFVKLLRSRANRKNPSRIAGGSRLARIRSS